MSDENQTESKESTKKPKVKRPLAEARAARKASRRARRQKLTKLLATDAEFKAKYFEAKSTRAAARVSAFKKAKSGKK
jgi:hypothetical protein